MRKVFIVALALLMALVGMSAAAMAAEIVTPLVSGAALNSHVPFSNGFTGFCIDQDLQGASSGMEYVANDMSYAVNQNNDPISEQLKTVLTCFRDDVFEQEDNGGYAYKYHISSSSGLWLFKVFYGFSDNYHIANPEFYKYSQNAVQLINDVKAHVHDSDCPNLSGDAVELLLPDGTLAKYEFKVLVPKADDKKATHQKFFAYKIDYYREMTANEDSAVVFNATINEYAQSGVPEGERYAWEKINSNGTVTPLENTDGLLQLDLVKPSDGGRYRCVVTDESNCKTNYYFDLTVNGTDVPPANNPPVITYPVQNEKVNHTVDEQIELTVEATDADKDDVLTYTWYKKEGSSTPVKVDSANSSKLTIDNCTMDDHNDQYYCEVSDGKSTVTSKTFTLNITAVCVPPVIKDLTVNGSSYADGSEYVAANGENVTLCVKAENANKYQWSVKEAGSADFTDIGTGEDYGPFAAAPKDNGSVYRCTVSNDCDKTGVSISIVLKVLSVDWDCERPAGVAEGTEVPLKIKAFNASTYEWYVKRGTQTVLVASGEDATSYTIPASEVTEEKTGSQYICVAKNEDKTAETSAFVLNVFKQADDTPPAFVRPESEVEIPFNAGKTVTLTMPSEDGEFASFAWYGIGGSGESTLFDGENTDTLVIENCAPEYDGAVVVCVAEDEAGNTTSLAFKLVLVPEGEPPVIISPTSDAEISACEGENVTLNIAAENADSYQWYVDKDNDGLMEEIEGAVGTSYTISSVTKGMNGYRYACVAFNDFGFAGSPVFELNVNGVPKMPATGDRSMPFVWLGMMLASAAACVYMLRSRRAE